MSHCAGWTLKTAIPLCLLFVTTPLHAAEKPRDVLKALVQKLDAGPSQVLSVLTAYSRIEAYEKFDIFGRHQIHKGLLAKLRRMDDDGLTRPVRMLLRSTARSRFPAQVIAMKALIGDRFPASREQRIDWLVEKATGRSEQLAVWGVRLLGESRWRESVDKLIELLREEEASDPTSFLASLLSAELYRVLGARGRGTAYAIRKKWEESGRKIPSKPDYALTGGGEVTVVFFGDRISPASVFCIDISSSMLQKATLKQGSSGATAVKDRKRSGPRSPKIEIVKKELVRALGGLQSHCRFNILSYDAEVAPWRESRGQIELHRAGSSTLRSAIEFAENLQAGRGTNIHDSLEAALKVEDVETVYLLSDGVPSRGGNQAQIEKMAAAMNYLRGVRIVTYGFTPEGSGSYDEAFMRRLAQENWGWYRRLN